MKNPSTFFTRKVVTLDSHATKTVAVTGNYFLVTESNGPFTIQFDDMEPLDAELGIGFEFAAEDFFSLVTLTNSGADAVTLTFYAARGRVWDNRLNVIDTSSSHYLGIGSAPPYVLVHDLAGDQLAGLAHLDLPGTGAGGTGLGQRAALLVSNLDPALNLEVLESGSATHRVATAFFGEVLELVSGADLRVANENATAVSCRICETFWGQMQ